MVQKRRGNLYNPESKIPFNISRSKIDLFWECPRCFYLDRRLGVSRPDMPGWALNSAVDTLLKNEFDLLRQAGQSHELMKKYNIDAIPFNHAELGTWRDDNHRYIGASVLHRPTNLNICGIVDDIWIDKKTDELYIVDYKATSTNSEISLEDEYKQGYKRQMEIYQWIFRQLGFKVSNRGYFLFANAGKNRPQFDAKLEFTTSIIPYDGNDAWVGSAIVELKKCLDAPKIPNPSPTCKYCGYRELVRQEELAERAKVA